MRVTDISLYSNNIETVAFSLSQAEPDAQYYVRDMAGLDSEDLIPRFYGFGAQTKTKFYDFVLKPRLIVIRFVLNPRFNLDESYSDVRDGLYKSISSARSGLIYLHFNSGGSTVARIAGFITKFEVPYFTPLPEVQLTVRCDDPILRGVNPVLYKQGEIKITNPIIIPDSLSTAPHGFSFQVTFKAACPSFTIQDQQDNPDWKFQVIPSGGFLVGDILNFSSEHINKQLYITRGATVIYLVDKITTDSIWPVIFPGTTTLYFVDIASFDWNSVEYNAAYWGV
jgi:hypothetical protein